MKLRELVEKLNTLVDEYGHLDVLSEGCDCDGDGEVNDAIVDGEGVGVIYLTRKSRKQMLEEEAESARRKAEYEKKQWEQVEGIKHLLPEGHDKPV